MPFWCRFVISRAVALAGNAVLLLLLHAAVLPAAEARLDWIILRDGTKVGAREGWEVRGASVVLTTPEGKLVSLPLEEVDLNATFRESTVPEPPGAAVVLIDVPPEPYPEEEPPPPLSLAEHAAANRVSDPRYTLVDPMKGRVPAWMVAMANEGASAEDIRAERDRRAATEQQPAGERPQRPPQPELPQQKQ
jgi:hypothetical protein